MDVRDTVIRVLSATRAEHSADADLPDLPDLRDDTALLGSGLDSLGFAVVVTELEDELGFDPFVESDTPYYPETVGDFIRFYETFQRAR